MGIDDDEVDAKIEMFFSWYKRRLANAAALSETPAPPAPGARTGTFLPEQHVLIGSGLDALSIAWARVLRPDLHVQGTPHGKRWSEFLQANANSSGIFDRVAGPMLADHIEEECSNVSGAEGIREVVRDTDSDRTGVVRHWDDDPQYVELVADARVIALQLKPGQVERFRYGEVLYREYRCHWSHHLYESEKLAPSDYDQERGWDAESSVRVRYQNYGMRPHRTEPDRFVSSSRRPLFTLRWLLRLYDDCIVSFERACIANRRHPMPQ